MYRALILFETLALYKSFTYLLTYAANPAIVMTFYVIPL